MAEGRQKKIALIGKKGYEYSSSEARVECFPWDRLKKVPNLADYDVVLLDLLSLSGVEILDYATFRKMLDVRIAQEVLGKTSGVIFVLGDPRFRAEWQSGDGVRSEPFLAWTGVEFEWDARSGDTVERSYDAERGSYKPFADKLTGWDYSLVGCRPDIEEVAKVWNVKTMREQGQQPTAMVREICTNSYGNALVFSVAHGVDRYTSGVHSSRLNSRETVYLSNPIIFLPESALSEDEALEFILRDLCSVDVSAPEPEWVSEFVVPGQEKVDSQIAELRSRIEEMIEEHDRKVEKRAEVREPLKLLYESGMALEEAVWAVLEALGAEVERPEERTNEDGWIVVQVGDETFEGVLEIKGVKGGHFNLEGLRQITDWIERGMTFREKRYFGIFVGNSAIKNPPWRRIWPFNHNWARQAEMRGYAGIRSEDLYVLYLLDQTSRLDRDQFWRELFSTKGPFDMRAYRERLTDVEEDQMANLPQP